MTKYRDKSQRNRNFFIVLSSYVKELQCKKGQDNVWPLVRMVHDEEWYKTDQILHWNFVNGRLLLDAVVLEKVFVIVIDCILIQSSFLVCFLFQNLQQSQIDEKIIEIEDENMIHTDPKVVTC
jgi:hypothetical protein